MGTGTGRAISIVAGGLGSAAALYSFDQFRRNDWSMTVERDRHAPLSDSIPAAASGGVAGVVLGAALGHRLIGTQVQLARDVRLGLVVASAFAGVSVISAIVAGTATQGRYSPAAEIVGITVPGIAGGAAATLLHFGR